MNPDTIRIIVALVIAVLLLAQFQRSAAGSRRRLALGLGAAAMVVIATSNMIAAASLPLIVVGGGLALGAVWLLWQAYQRGELEERFERARRYLEAERRRYDEHNRGGSRDD